jgi:trans-aconitate methyltransferase
MDSTHQQFFSRFLEACPPHGLRLDTTCGTGMDWPMILSSGNRAFGINQSQAMVNRAHAKFPDVPIVNIGIQEISEQAAFKDEVCV